MRVGSVPGTGAAAGSPQELSARVAGGLAVLWSSVVTLFGLMIAALLPLMVTADRNNGYCESIDHPGPCSSLASAAVPGLVVAAVGLWGVASGVGLRRGRGWPRWAVMVTFSSWAAAMLAGLIGAAVSPDGSSAGGVIVMLLLLAVCVTIVVQAARAQGQSSLKAVERPHDRS
jgi:hypothetical protein